VRRVFAEHRRTGKLRVPPLTQGVARKRDEWAEVFRRAPIGVLVLGFMLLLIGGGLILGGALFVFSGRPSAWPVWIILFGAGPLAIYLALQFISGQGWAWTTVIAMLVLVLISSGVRAIRAEVLPVVPFAEILVSLAVLAYLARPRVRQAFGR
jgi:hypothetical protein